MVERPLQLRGTGMNLRKILQLMDCAPANAPVRVELDGVEYAVIDIYHLNGKLFLMADFEVLEPMGMYRAADFVTDVAEQEFDTSLPVLLGNEDKIRHFKSYPVDGAAVRWMDDSAKSAVVIYAVKSR